MIVASTETVSVYFDDAEDGLLSDFGVCLEKLTRLYHLTRRPIRQGLTKKGYWEEIAAISAESASAGINIAASKVRSLEAANAFYPALFVLSGQDLELESNDQGTQSALAADRP